MKSVFEFTGGIKSYDPGVQWAIKSTVSKKDGIFDEIIVWIYGRDQIQGPKDPGVQWAIKSTESIKNPSFQ